MPGWSPNVGQILAYRQGKPVTAKPVTEVITGGGGGGKWSSPVRTMPLPMPDTSAAFQSGRPVTVTDTHLAESFVPGLQGRGSGLGLFIHPQTGKWVSFQELPTDSSGKRQALGQQDGNPFVNRSGTIELADRPSQDSGIRGFLNPEGILPVLAAAAPLVLGALAPGAAAAGAAGTAASAAAPEIGAGLFAGGVEQAALGASPGLLGGVAEAAPLTMAGVGASNFAAPALGGGSQMASSGLMDWLGKPTVQVAGQLASAGLQGYAANQASQQQAQAAQAGIEEQRRQFDATRQALAPFAATGESVLGNFAPYMGAGLQAFQQQQELAGLRGPQAQRAMISNLEASPEYQALARQGEEAILQRASATGGLRGGNVQAALAQFRPAMLQQLIDQQYQRLGGFAGTGLQTTSQLASMGQSAAAQQGQFGANAASNIGNLLAQQGQAQALGTVGMARSAAQALNIPAAMQEYQAGRDLYRT